MKCQEELYDVENEQLKKRKNKFGVNTENE